MIYTLLLLFFLNSINADPVNVHFGINCKPDEADVNIGTWCTTVVVYEEDTEANHDILTNGSFCTSSDNGVLDFSVSPGGDASPSYEISYTLTHNCTIDRLLRCITPREPKDASIFGTVNIDFNVDVYEIGEARKCRDPNHTMEDFRLYPKTDKSWPF